MLPNDKVAEEREIIMSTKCKHDCFNCPYDDCKIETASSEERKEIRERDNRYYNSIESKGVVKQRPNRAKHRGKRRVIA
jgi:hypothetical protein